MVQFVRYPDPSLARAAVARPVDEPMRAVARRLLEAQLEVQSHGLAAAHIGEIEPIVVINLGIGTARQDTAWFNPEVLTVAAETAPGTEGSVSLPGVEAQIERPVWAMFGYEDWDGNCHEMRLEGFHARVAMHEIDQVRGRFFLDGLSRLKRERLLKKATKRRDG